MYLFGSAPSFLIPLCLMFIGWKNLTGSETSAATLLFLSAFVCEISLLFAINNLPQLCGNPVFISDNYIGNLLTYSLHYPFGPHRFGPYFLTLFCVFLTVLLCFRINPVRACVSLYAFARLRRCGSAQFFRRLVTKQNEEPAGAEKAGGADAKQKKQGSRRRGGCQQGDEELERERQLAQEKELAAFRAKLSDPVRITTMGVPQEKENEAEDAEDARTGSRKFH